MCYRMHTRLKGLNEMIDILTRVLAPRKDQFDYIAVRGQSGIVPGSIMAHKFQKELILVRKEDEKSHGSPVEAPLEWDSTRRRGELSRQVLRERTIIIDDFVNGGDTMAAIFKALMYRPKLIVLYGQTTEYGRHGRARHGITRMNRSPHLWKVSETTPTYEELPC